MNEDIEKESVMDQLFMSQTELVEKLEILAHEGGSFIDAIIEFAERYEMETEDIASLLSRSFLQKLKEEAISYNLIKEKAENIDISQFFQ